MKISLEILLRAAVCAAIALLAAPGARAQKRFTCQADDPKGTCASLLIKSDHTIVTSYAHFTFDSTQKRDLVVNPGDNAVRYMFYQSASKLEWWQDLPSPWVVQLQKKKSQGSGFDPEITVCSDDGKTIRMKSINYDFSEYKYDLGGFGTPSYRTDQGDSVDSQLAYYKKDCAGGASGMPDGTQKCSDSDCWVVFSTQKPASALIFSDMAQHPYNSDMDDSPMPMDGGSIEFRTKLDQSNFKIKGNQMRVQKGASFVSHITAENRDNGIDISIPLKDRNWTLVVKLQSGRVVRLKGRDRGKTVFFEGPAVLAATGTNPDGTGARVKAEDIKSVRLKLGLFTSIPMDYSFFGPSLIVHYQVPK